MAQNNGTDGNRSAYPLNRDLMASVRLDLQHYLWVKSLGYLLHPSISLKTNSHIAEIGCGTGLFSLEMAKTLPQNSSVEASDLSIAQCPPKGWWPGNVTFQKLDIFEPIPEDIVGRYNLVCIRHFVCVVSSGDPTTLLAQLLKVLKPGGYLQWQESDLTTSRIRLADPDSATPKLQTYFDMLQVGMKFESQTSWMQSFHARFDSEEAGAELVAHDRKWAPDEALMLKLEVHTLSIQELCNNLRVSGVESEQWKKIDKVSREAYEECVGLGKGALIDHEMVTWVVRKK